MAIVSSSGNTGFAPSLGEMTLEAFARIQIRAPSMTAEHWWNARMSANLLQSEWSSVGVPLLWKMELLQVVLQPGVSDYAMPARIIAPMDAYIRTYQLGTAQDFAPAFAADAGDTLVTVTQALHGLAAGSIVFYATAIAASGQVIQGSYLVTGVIDQNNYQITVPSAMDGTDSVALPVFATTAGSTTVQITLAAHGLAIGGSFYCNVPVEVGGLTLSGQLVVTGVVSPNVFQVTAGSAASSTDSETMNGGQAQAQTQAPGLDPVDYVVTQISRSDYAGQPDKGPNLQYRPTAFWFQRLRTPVVSLWTPPDDNSPYVLNLWAMVQPEDAETGGGVGIDVVYRFLEPYAAGLAAKLGRKYPPDPTTGGSTVADLRDEAKAVLEAALREDIERVPLYIAPGMSGYWR